MTRDHAIVGRVLKHGLRKTTSDLGWAFLGLIDGGRIKEDADDGADITRIYRHQLASCTYEVLPGPGKLLRWSVPARRGHDELLISTALTARLDAIDWRDRTARGSGQRWRNQILGWGLIAR
jgi:hypothetical protein